MCIGNTTSPAANSTINWYPREEERVTTLGETPQIGDPPAPGGKDRGKPNRSKVSGGSKPGKQSNRY